MGRPGSEADFRAAWPLPERAEFLAGSGIELLRRPPRAVFPCHALFDFDGTLSLIREGWTEIMVPMMVDILLPLARPGETPALIEALVRDFVAELTGKQTIYQMMRLADEVRLRGGHPLDSQDYKDEYLARLMARISSRREGLASGIVGPESQTVPGCLDLLRLLRERGVTIWIASGTDETAVIEEASLLGIDAFAPGRIFGARPDLASFSKEGLIRRILAENRLSGASLLCFGDGFVEIAACKAAGGIAIAVASDEAQRSGRPDPWKRERLIAAGADLVVPDFRDCGALIAYIFDRPDQSLPSRQGGEG